MSSSELERVKVGEVCDINTSTYPQKRNWKNSIIGDVAKYANIRISSKELTPYNYVSTENMLPNRGGMVAAASLPSGNVVKYHKGQTLVSNIRPYFKKIWHAKNDGGCSTDVLVFEIMNDVDDKFFYYYLSQENFFEYVMAGSKGTKMPRGDKQQILMYPFSYPSKNEQKSIAAILSCLDDKIELNNKINDNLEKQANAIFQSVFFDFNGYTLNSTGDMPVGWHTGNLLDIATYLNGLTMQKYRPKDGEIGLPVLKIKELRQGYCDTNSEFCSPSVKSEYIVHDGDVIFSWSGSLLVDFWCGGVCGLNQHLFKVTSTKYDTWFSYAWTNYHLKKFIAIAADKATTMGHIKREDLTKSEVLIPSESDYKQIANRIAPLYEMIVANRIMNRHLANIRDTLLPKLMSGEIDVSNINT